MRDWVSVDVETAGPYPAGYALLSVGACLVTDPDVTFYVELEPDRDDVDAEAMAVHGLSMEALKAAGTPPAAAMAALADWLADTVGSGRPRMVALNAPFDWSFVNDYFWRYLGRNPFGHSAIDIKALAMGRLGIAWEQTSLSALARRFGSPDRLTHHALEDAQQQAELTRHIVETGDGS
jgi:DNA polymerase III epsilon subunit-like protein